MVSYPNNDDVYNVQSVLTPCDGEVSPVIGSMMIPHSKLVNLILDAITVPQHLRGIMITSGCFVIIYLIQQMVILPSYVKEVIFAVNTSICFR